MILEIPDGVLRKIHAHGAAAYPEEGAGVLFGRAEGDRRRVVDLFPFPNAREEDARHNRYLITARDMLQAERESMRRGLDVIGIFHSHPDHPNEPSEFDRQWALPWYSYVITTVSAGRAGQSRSWRLTDDRETFEEEEIVTIKLADGQLEGS